MQCLGLQYLLEMLVATKMSGRTPDSIQQMPDASGKLLKAIPSRELGLNLPWQSFDIAHEPTTEGIRSFVADDQTTLRRSA
jgi:hypothetical protein